MCKENTVRCMSCGRHYLIADDPINPGDTEECAATADFVPGKMVITGHFGSYVADMLQLESSNPPEWVEQGQICDQCIVRISNEGGFNTPLGITEVPKYIRSVKDHLQPS